MYARAVATRKKKPTPVPFADHAEVVIDQTLAKGEYRSPDGQWALTVRGDAIDVTGEPPTEILRALAARKAENAAYVVKRARTLQKAGHYTEVEEAAREILEQAAEEYDNFENAREMIDQLVSEHAATVTVHTSENLNMIVGSDNWEAIDDAIDEGLVEGFSSFANFSDLIDSAAEYAVRADVYDAIKQLEAAYFDEDDDDDDD